MTYFSPSLGFTLILPWALAVFTLLCWGSMPGAPVGHQRGALLGVWDTVGSSCPLWQCQNELRLQPGLLLPFRAELHRGGGICHF